MTSKSDMAYETLKRDIIASRIPPDAPLRIQSLGSSTGFGSTPVREALRRLESEQFVISEANFGFRVAPMSTELLQDLEASRLVIETALLTDAMAQGDDKWEAELIAAHHRLKKGVLPIHTRNPDAITDWSQRHQGFHDALLSASSYSTLKEFQRHISEQLERHYFYTMTGARRAVFEGGNDVKDVLADALSLQRHTQLMEAAIDRNTGMAAALLNDHIRLTSNVFSQLFAGGDRPDSDDRTDQSKQIVQT